MKSQARPLRKNYNRIRWLDDYWLLLRFQAIHRNVMRWRWERWMSLLSNPWKGFSIQTSWRILNKKLGSPINRDILRSIRQFCIANLPISGEINYDDKGTFTNMNTLVNNKKFPNIPKYFAFRVICCLRQFRNAHAHNSVVDLVKYKNICLPAIVIMSSPRTW